MPINEVLNIARSICEALEAAHEKDIIHRDLKPANVRVQPEGPGWKRIVATAGGTKKSESRGLSVEFANWALGCALIYASLFAIGKLVFKEWRVGMMLAVVSIAAATLISWNLRRGSRSPSAEQRLQWD